MKFSLEWLRYFLDTEATLAEISAKLNAIGIEVEGIGVDIDEDRVQRHRLTAST